jgi:hypothetical protein
VSIFFIAQGWPDYGARARASWGMEGHGDAKVENADVDMVRWSGSRGARGGRMKAAHSPGTQMKSFDSNRDVGASLHSPSEAEDTCSTVCDVKSTFSVMQRWAVLCSLGEPNTARYRHEDRRIVYKCTDTMYAMLSLPTIPREVSTKAIDDLGCYLPWRTTSPRPCLLLRVCRSRHRTYPVKMT